MTDPVFNVVLDPAVILTEIQNPQSRPILNAWKAGVLRPVLSRKILRHTLTFLSEAGLDHDLMSIWAIWLGHPDRIYPVHEVVEGPITAVYSQPCLSGQAQGLVTEAVDVFTNIRTYSPAGEWLHPET